MNGQPPSEPLRLTMARWLNRRHRTRDVRGEPTERFRKVLAHTGSYDQFAYGTDTPSDWSGPLQRAIICSPRSGVIAIDVDDEQVFSSSRTAQYVSRADALSTRGGGFHVLIDARSVPPDQWPRQGPIPGGDIKSCGFIPVPGCLHWTEQQYQPVLHDGLSRVITATPAIIAAINADRNDHHPAASANGSSGGHGGGHDGEIAGTTLTMVIKRLRAGWQPGAELAEDVYREWQSVAVPRDPGWSFERSDFERHFGGALAKAREIIRNDQPVSEDAMQWAMGAMRTPDTAVVTGTVVQRTLSRRVELTPASAIPMRRVRWLVWLPGVLEIPMGELALFAGREGTGKSQATLWIAACITRGIMPGELRGKPRSVIIASREDSWEHTIKPRLVACGADMDRVFRVDVTAIDGGKVHLTLPEDNADLERKIAEYRVALVILDPVLSAVSARLNTHKASEVRQALEPMSQMGHRTGCAFIGLTHFNKMTGQDLSQRMMDSQAFAAVTRAIVGFAMDDVDTGVMTQPKNTLGRKPSKSMEYQISAKLMQIEGQWSEIAYFVPGDKTDRSAEDMLDVADMRQLAIAKDFLRGVLAGGPVLSKDVEERAKQEGISERTLNRARSDLRVRARQTPDGWVIGG